MAKAVFIINPNVVQHTVKHLRNLNQYSSIYDDFSYEKNYFITSQKTFDESEDLLKKTSFVYIQPELNWTSINYRYYGYHLALNLIKGHHNVSTLSLTFVTFLDRKYLLNTVKEKNHSLVKIFNHIRLPLSYDRKLPTRKLSTVQWDFFKNYILTSSGLLDDLLHKVDMLKYQNDDKNLNELLTQITLQEKLVGPEIIEQVKIFQNNNSTNQTEFINQLYLQLQNRLVAFKPKHQEEIKLTPNFKLLLIEDNPNHADLLIESLSRYLEIGKSLFIYSNGKEALTELEDQPNEYNLILVDLELLNADGFYQPVQGVDILSEIQSNHPRSVFKVVTGLGRKGVRELLKLKNKDILAKKQLYSFDTDVEVNRLLTEMTEEFSKREEKYFINFGPKKSYFNWPLTRSILNEYWTDQKFKHKTLTWVDKYFKRFQNFDLSSKDWDNTLPSRRTKDRTNLTSFVENRLKSLLLFRRILLFLSSKNNFILEMVSSEEDYYDIDQYSQFSDLLKRNGIIINKGLIDRAALSYETSKRFKKIELINLFPEEIRFIDNILMERSDILIKDNSDEILNFCNKYLDFEIDDLNKMDVPVNLTEWTFIDLRNCWKYLMNQLKSKDESVLAQNLISSLDDLNGLIEHELSIHIPDLQSDLDYLYSKA